MSKDDFKNYKIGDIVSWKDAELDLVKYKKWPPSMKITAIVEKRSEHNNRVYGVAFRFAGQGIQREVYYTRVRKAPPLDVFRYRILEAERERNGNTRKTKKSTSI